MAVIKPQNPIINGNHPLVKGLVFDMPFFEQAGLNARDLISNKTGTLTNGPIWTTSLGGTGVAMQGSDDHVNFVTPSTMNQLSQYSIQLIVTRKSSGLTGGDGGLFFKSNGTTKYFDIENNNGDIGWGIAFVSYWSGGTVRVWSVPYPTNNVVQNYIITYNHSDRANVPKWYINGVDTALTDRFNNANTTPQTDGTQLHIGNNEQATPTNAWDGNIYLARIWNRILIPTEVKALTRNPWQIYQSTNFSWYFNSNPAIIQTSVPIRMLTGFGF